MLPFFFFHLLAIYSARAHESVLHDSHGLSLSTVHRVSTGISCVVTVAKNLSLQAGVAKGVLASGFLECIMV